MTTPLILEPGIYTNVFPVVLPEGPFRAKTAKRSDFTDLRALREEFEREGSKTRVFADGKTVYAYGPDADTLKVSGFSAEEVEIARRPGLAKRLVIEALADATVKDGYELRDRIGRLTIYLSKPRATAANGRIRVHLGYDLRALYWRAEVEDPWRFGVIVDVKWSVRDDNGLLDSKAIAAYGAMVEVARIQGEYLPGGSRINSEVARERFQGLILPFVRRYEQLMLPCGLAHLLPEPLRVVLGTQR